jgi:hypothetical protein
MQKYEEYRNISQGRLWLIILAFTLCVLAWGMFIHMMVPETPRHWDFGTLPQPPSESKYSTVAPPTNSDVPIQLERPAGVQGRGAT